MHLIPALIAADADGLSRVNPLLLPEETLLEMFFDGVENKDHLDFTNERFFIRDHTTAVTSIWITPSFNRRPLYGSVNFAFLPQTVTVISLRGNVLQGPLDVERWPAALCSVSLEKNEFSGDLRAEKLPRDLIILNLHRNKLVGSVDMGALPPKLEELRLDDNELAGTVDTRALSRALRTLSLSKNNFSGLFSLDGLPEGLIVLHIASNNFSGTLSARSLPSLEILLANNNAFCGVLTIGRIRAVLSELDVSSNQITGVDIAADSLAVLRGLRIEDNPMSREGRWKLQFEEEEE